MGLHHSHGHHDHGHSHKAEALTPRYIRILWIALVVNFAMFFVEIASGLAASSVSLLADAADFLGDGVNYGLSLAALGMASIVGSKIALAKGFAMGLFGIFILGKAALQWASGVTPEATTMGAIGVLALCANLFVAALLYQYRTGNANMRSVWLCTRNDAISNLLVIAAAIGVWGTTKGWPDLAVAAVMGCLALWSSQEVIRHALKELNAPAKHPN
jgi:Co/Zn/Cd efflux system component